MNNEDEIFKQIIDYPNYKISNLGQVLNSKTGKILKPHLFNTGYLRVNLYKDIKPKLFYIHRLIAFYFIDNPDNKQYVDHKNNIRTDNRIENLRFVNSSENSMNSGLPKTSTSGFKGVYYETRGKKWVGSLNINGEKISKRFETKEEALEYRLELSRIHFKEHAHSSEQLTSINRV